LHATGARGLILREKWDALKKQGPAVPINRNYIILFCIMYYKKKLHMSNYITNKANKKGKVGKLSSVHLNLHLNFFINSNLS
jgi:hypothetical protein